MGAELTERTIPAEAGVVERSVSLHQGLLHRPGAGGPHRQPGRQRPPPPPRLVADEPSCRSAPRSSSTARSWARSPPRSADLGAGLHRPGRRAAGGGHGRRCTRSASSPSRTHDLPRRHRRRPPGAGRGRRPSAGQGPGAGPGDGGPPSLPGGAGGHDRRRPDRRGQASVALQGRPGPEPGPGDAGPPVRGRRRRLPVGAHRRAPTSAARPTTSARPGRRVAVPVLRKDFTVDEADVCDARLMGADAVLLIVAALDDAELRPSPSWPPSWTWPPWSRSTTRPRSTGRWRPAPT